MEINEKKWSKYVSFLSVKAQDFFNLNWSDISGIQALLSYIFQIVVSSIGPTISYFFAYQYQSSLWPHAWSIWAVVLFLGIFVRPCMKMKVMVTSYIAFSWFDAFLNHETCNIAGNYSDCSIEYKASCHPSCLRIPDCHDSRISFYFLVFHVWFGMYAAPIFPHRVSIVSLCNRQFLYREWWQCPRLWGLRNPVSLCLQRDAKQHIICLRCHGSNSTSYLRIDTKASWLWIHQSFFALAGICHTASKFSSDLHRTRYSASQNARLYIIVLECTSYQGIRRSTIQADCRRWQTNLHSWHFGWNDGRLGQIRARIMSEVCWKMQVYFAATRIRSKYLLGIENERNTREETIISYMASSSLGRYHGPDIYSGHKSRAQAAT